MAIQTPKQRIANNKFNKDIEKNRKYGKKKIVKKSSDKPAISKYWLYVFMFLLLGGGILELIHLIF